MIWTVYYKDQYIKISHLHSRFLELNFQRIADKLYEYVLEEMGIHFLGAKRCSNIADISNILRNKIATKGSVIP